MQPCAGLFTARALRLLLCQLAFCKSIATEVEGFHNNGDNFNTSIFQEVFSSALNGLLQQPLLNEAALAGAPAEDIPVQEGNQLRIRDVPQPHRLSLHLQVEVEEMAPQATYSIDFLQGCGFQNHGKPLMANCLWKFGDYVSYHWRFAKDRRPFLVGDVMAFSMEPHFTGLASMMQAKIKDFAVSCPLCGGVCVQSVDGHTESTERPPCRTVNETNEYGRFLLKKPPPMMEKQAKGQRVTGRVLFTNRNGSVLADVRMYAEVGEAVELMKKIDLPMSQRDKMPKGAAPAASPLTSAGARESVAQSKPKPTKPARGPGGAEVAHKAPVHKHKLFR